MAAPCDPAPQNSIIVVCAVYVKDGDESPERIFAGAPCWYTDAPNPGGNRKRTRSNRDDNDHTFVTTRYDRRKNSKPTSFAGICIGQPTHNRTGIVTIGVAISGAVTIARLLPGTDGNPPDPPNPGDGAFFGNSGIIEFKAARIRPSSLCDFKIYFIIFMGSNPEQQAKLNDNQGEALNEMTTAYLGATEDLTEDDRAFVFNVFKAIYEKDQNTLDSIGVSDEEYSWARVLDTGSGNTVRLLLRL